MVVNKDQLKDKLDLLGLAVAKSNSCKQVEKMIRFESIGDTVYAYTFDGINNIRVSIGKCNEDFYALVDYNLFSNFIKSCENDITLEAKNKFLHIKSSNVKCKLPTYNHEVDRKQTGIPNPVNNYDYDKTFEEPIDLNLIKSILDPTNIIETYRLIYFGDNIMVTDTDNVIKIEKRVFDEDVLLHLSSIYILNNATNCSYSFSSFKNNTHKLLCIKSDEFYATSIVGTNENNDFQYNDLLGLFTDISGDKVTLDTTILSKAINASNMFKINPVIVFNNKGIFVQIDAIEFIYKISNEKCDDRTFELSQSLVKKITSLGKEVAIYYTNKDLIKCEVDGVAEILSVNEVMKVD